MPKTVGAALNRLSEDFGLGRMIVVGDPGMLTDARMTTRVGDSEITFEQCAEPTELQKRAFELLDVSWRLRMS